MSNSLSLHITIYDCYFFHQPTTGMHRCFMGPPQNITRPQRILQCTCSLSFPSALHIQYHGAGRRTEDRGIVHVQQKTGHKRTKEHNPSITGMCLLPQIHHVCVTKRLPKRPPCSPVVPSIESVRLDPFPFTVSTTTIMQVVPCSPLFRIAASSLLFLSTLSSRVAAADIVRLPHVSVYMVCNTGNSNGGSRSGQLTPQAIRVNFNATQMWEEEMKKFFFQYLLNLPNTDNKALTVKVNSTVATCVSSDLAEVALRTEGTIDWSQIVPDGSSNATTYYSEADFGALVTNQSVKDYMAKVCYKIVTVETQVLPAENPPPVDWKEKFVNNFCSNNSPRHLSTWSIVLIVASGLLLICVVACVIQSRSKREEYYRN